MGNKQQTDTEKLIDGATGIAKRIGSAVKRTAYDVASRIERAAEDPTNPLGKAVETAKGLDKKVQQEGGYGAVARKAGKEVTDFARENIGEPISGLYKKVQDGFFDEAGNFDNEKARNSLRDIREAGRNYGEKAVNTLTSMARDGVRAIGTDYRNMVPTEQEKKTKYAGIGSDYRGVLFREHFESCLAFHESARINLPGGLRLRSAILSDIKSTASGNIDDLVKHYENTNQPERAETARNYLVKKTKSRK